MKYLLQVEETAQDVIALKCGILDFSRRFKEVILSNSEAVG